MEYGQSWSSTMAKLVAGQAILEVTPTHRISVPHALSGSSGAAPVTYLAGQPGGSSPTDTKQARELTIGDFVCCEDGVNQLTHVEEYELETPVPVFNIRFKPDVPVLVFSPPPNRILSRGTLCFYVFLFKQI